MGAYSRDQRAVPAHGEGLMTTLIASLTPRTTPAVTRARHRRVWWGVLLPVALGACGGANGTAGPDAPTPVLMNVYVTLTADTIETGLSATATASGLDQRSAPFGIAAVTWSSTSPAIATVTPAGVVTALATGQTTLVASAGGRQGQRLLTVVPPVVAHLLITPETARLVRGASLPLVTSAITANGRVVEGRPVVFATSDTTLATVTPSGVVTARSAGEVVITATSEGTMASTALTVTAIPDSVQTVVMSPERGAVSVGGVLQLSATLLDARGVALGGRVPAWTVTGVVGANVATVSSTGLVTATGPGTAIVQAASEGQHGSATIIVADNLDPRIIVTFAEPVENALVGDTLKIVANATAPNPITSVVAEVGPMRKVVRLALRPVGAFGSLMLWVGFLDVTDIPSGPCQILLTATDNGGARGVATRQFQRDTRKGKGGSSIQPPGK